MTRRVSLLLIMFLLNSVLFLSLGVIIGNTKADSTVQAYYMGFSDVYQYTVDPQTSYESSETSLFSSEEFKGGHSDMGW